MREIKRAEGAPSAFSMSVIAMVDDAVGRSGIPVKKILETAEMSRNYYYKRLRGEASFTTTDVDKIAKALGIDPFDLLSEASVRRK
ncbi:helix-turn-helix transcriptional regulator [Lysinibacter sp. HNR]|uniref:helix-turn-helix domain-containing protein n=1 Tax=Lysinibacter sp. HNR TaxID=3031408 RepID=UPI00243539DF|nr:helix-turn-helix transcriptional regulator [Lysinibacter sp. HNR]WGD38507.1 helix-turn-helix transcriptional regulator [Lysinibacter sp. HNR]